jgi:hypothetical protein
MKKITIFFILALFLFSYQISVAQEPEQINAGLVSDVWYSKTPFFAGEDIRIYSAIWNQSGFDIIGKINFIDGKELIGESNFSISDGELFEKSITWKASEGEHSFRVEVFNARKVSGGEEVSVSLIAESSNVNKQFADLDSDFDGVGNKIDKDDDGDGVFDNEEIKFGTDPLVFNEESDFSNASTTKSRSKIEEGKNIAEKFVINPAKEVTEKALIESRPIIERIGDFLVNKSLDLDEKIKEDEENEAELNLADLGFYENIQKKLPPVFRILYSWLLKGLILFFSIWWLPLIVSILIVLRILLAIFRKIRGR